MLFKSPWRATTHGAVPPSVPPPTPYTRHDGPSHSLAWTPFSVVLTVSLGFAATPAAYLHSPG